MSDGISWSTDICLLPCLQDPRKNSGSWIALVQPDRTATYQQAPTHQSIFRLPVALDKCAILCQLFEQHKLPDPPLPPGPQSAGLQRIHKFVSVFITLQYFNSCHCAQALFSLHRRLGLKKTVNRTAVAHAQRVSALKEELAALVAENDHLAAQACEISATEAALKDENQSLVAQSLLLEGCGIEPPCWEDLTGDSPPQVRDVMSSQSLCSCISSTTITAAYALQFYPENPRLGPVQKAEGRHLDPC